MTSVFNTFYPPEDTNHALDSAAYYDTASNEMVSFHVTDDPQRVLTALRDGTPMTSFKGSQDDFGPGLYCSMATQIWTGRALKKWDFLTNLSRIQTADLCAALRLTVESAPNGYLTESEIDSALRLIDNVASGRFADAGALVLLADQPYNFSFWKPDFLSVLGIQPGRQPSIAEVRMQGAFVRVENAKERNQVREERMFDGAYEVMGFSSVAQLCIWCTESITAFDGHRLPPAKGLFSQKSPPKCSRCGRPKSIQLHYPEHGMCRYVCEDCRGYLMTAFEEDYQ